MPDDDDRLNEIAKYINNHSGEIVTAIDIEGAPFHALNALVSAPRGDGVPRKVILWLSPESLNDRWLPTGEEVKQVGEETVSEAA